MTPFSHLRCLYKQFSGGRRLLHSAICSLCLFLLPTTALAATQPEIALRLSKSAILEGEPVWVLASVTNSSDREMVWNPGDYCSSWQKPVKADLDNERTPDNVIVCPHGEIPANAAAMSCVLGQNVVHLHPHQTVTQRFLLEGQFTLTTAGEHTVHLTLHPKYTLSQEINAVFLPGSALPAVEAALPLRIPPKNDVALLAIEQQLAKEASRPFMGAVVSAEQVNLAEIEKQQTLRGLSRYPVSGMESTFREWMTQQRFSSTARSGLTRLNTAEAHTILLQAAKTQQRQEQSSSLAALIATHQADDLSVLLDLLGSLNPTVHREAILGLGKVGGETAIPALLRLIHAGVTQDRNDALSALSDIRSHQAVRTLIDLLKEPTPISEARWPLYSLTHHQVGFDPNTQTPEQLAAAWEQWWNEGGKDAPLYDSLSSCINAD